MTIPKYYCSKCKKFKNVFEVKTKNEFDGRCNLWWKECRYCHEQVDETKDILLNLANSAK